MTMNGPKVIKVKMTGRDTFSSPLGHNAAFDNFQRDRISDFKLVSENGRPGIDVRVAFVHSAAKG